MMGLRRLSLYRYLILPASLPAFVAGLKQGWAFSWRSGLVAGEHWSSSRTSRPWACCCQLIRTRPKGVTGTV